MRARHGRVLSAAVLAMALAATLAGCGGFGGPGGGTTGTLPPPCTGKSLGNVSAIVVTVRGSDSGHDVGVPVGHVVEIQMDVHHTWQFESVAPEGILTPVGSQGIVLGDACVWDFQVAQAGDATVTLVGGALCAIGQPCPAYAILAKFTIHGY